MPICLPPVLQRLRLPALTLSAAVLTGCVAVPVHHRGPVGPVYPYGGPVVVPGYHHPHPPVMVVPAPGRPYAHPPRPAPQPQRPPYRQRHQHDGWSR